MEEEQAHGLHSFDGWDVSAKLEALHTHMDGVKDECDIEAGKLSTFLGGISNALLDLEKLPI
jgi:hypothetical protein